MDSMLLHGSLRREAKRPITTNLKKINTQFLYLSPIYFFPDHNASRVLANKVKPPVNIDS